MGFHYPPSLPKLVCTAIFQRVPFRTLQLDLASLLCFSTLGKTYLPEDRQLFAVCCFYFLDLLEIFPSNFYDSFVLLLLHILLFLLGHLHSPVVVAHIWVVFIIYGLFAGLDLQHSKWFLGLCDPHLTTITRIK